MTAMHAPEHLTRSATLPFTGLPAPEVSFEFFPPKTAKLEEGWWQAVQQLIPFNPQFVSVTFGAGGSTRARTVKAVKRINAETPLSAAAHLTCVGADRAEIDEIARGYWDAGIRHIVALRGDPPEGVGSGYVPHSGGYAYASDLVAGLRRIADFEISVAAYPEVHPQARSAGDDLDNLKRKLDAGASRAITQFFFDVDAFLRFRDRAAAAGITAPIVPGILPITNFGRAAEFAKACGAAVPDWIAELFDDLDQDAEARQLVAATVASEQCRLLQAEGVNAFHFYTLNRADLTRALCLRLGVRPDRALAN